MKTNTFINLYMQFIKAAFLGIHLEKQKRRSS